MCSISNSSSVLSSRKPSTEPIISEAPTSITTTSDVTKQLTAKQEIALTAILEAPTQEAAAKAAGISSMTLWRYLQQTGFREAYQQARHVAVGQAVTELQRSSLDAVKTLHAISMNEGAAMTARVNAAKAILDMSFKAAELQEVQERLEALEETNSQLDNSDSDDRSKRSGPRTAGRARRF